MVLKNNKNLKIFLKLKKIFLNFFKIKKNPLPVIGSVVRLLTDQIGYQ